MHDRPLGHLPPEGGQPVGEDASADSAEIRAAVWRACAFVLAHQVEALDARLAALERRVADLEVSSEPETPAGVGHPVDDDGHLDAVLGPSPTVAFWDELERSRLRWR